MAVEKSTYFCCCYVFVMRQEGRKTDTDQILVKSTGSQLYNYQTAVSQGLSGHAWVLGGVACPEENEKDAASKSWKGSRDAESAAIFDSSQRNIKVITGQSELGFTYINWGVKLFLIPV